MNTVVHAGDWCSSWCSQGHTSKQQKAGKKYPKSRKCERRWLGGRLHRPGCLFNFPREDCFHPSLLFLRVLYCHPACRELKASGWALTSPGLKQGMATSIFSHTDSAARRLYKSTTAERVDVDDLANTVWALGLRKLSSAGPLQVRQPKLESLNLLVRNLSPLT